VAGEARVDVLEGLRVDVLEGLRVDFPLVQDFFCKNSRICTIWTVRVPDRTAGKSRRRGHAGWPVFVA
jgi:hypothetical protein